jgi:hypothetical protein
LSTDLIRPWTIQYREAWDFAVKRGVLRADGRRAWLSFRDSYFWKRQQMCRRITGTSGRYPIWAWAPPKPDLRSPEHLPPGTNGVRVEFLADSSRVLLSDFGAWHAVLNRSYLALSEEEEDAAWETMVGDHWRYDDLADNHRSLLEFSWERIFDPQLILSSTWDYGGHVESQRIQATIEEVPLSQMVSVQPFVARQLRRRV